jgi:hypothetical protein
MFVQANLDWIVGIEFEIDPDITRFGTPCSFAPK